MSYIAQAPPDLGQNHPVIVFFEQFYQCSDTPDQTDRYVSFFDENADFRLVSGKAKGHGEIRKTREGMWAKVKRRHHYDVSIYPFGLDSNHVMLHGKVDMTLKEGGEIKYLPWAARADLKEVDGELKFGFYQIYLDSAAQKPS